MKSKKIIALVGIIGIFGSAAATPAFAATGNGFLSGPHYNLNIIGAKNVGDVGASDGHSMFVKLSGTTKIIMTQDPAGTFTVTDRNGLDGSASFNIAPGHYNVFARSLGKPGGKTSINANGTFMDALTGETLIPLGYVDISRTKGKSTAQNINSLFYVDVTLCTAIDSTTNTCTQQTTYTDTWVFDIPELLSYWWDYSNSNLKLLQVRFYPCSLDSTGTASDYCRWGDGSPINSSKTVVSF